MPEEDAEPPRKTFGFKSREFDRVNEPSSQEGGIDVRDHFRAAADSDQLPSAPSPAPKNDVHAHLEINAERAREAGLDDIELPPARPSRRQRDFLFLLLAGNGIFLMIGAFAYFTANAFVIVFAGTGALLFTLGLTWIMWAVMDKY